MANILMKMTDAKTVEQMNTVTVDDVVTFLSEQICGNIKILVNGKPLNLQKLIEQSNKMEFCGYYPDDDVYIDIIDGDVESESTELIYDEETMEYL